MKGIHFIFGFIVSLLLISACTPKNAVTLNAEQQGKEIAKPAGQEPQNAQQTPKQGIPAEIRELLGKSKTRVSSVYYQYRGPETGSNFHEFYIKSSKIKYKPHLEIKTLDKPESYDSIFIDTNAKSAASYCEAVY